MSVPTSEVGYTPATPRREDHEVHKKGHVAALEKKKTLCVFQTLQISECLHPYHLGTETQDTCTAKYIHLLTETSLPFMLNSNMYISPQFAAVQPRISGHTTHLSQT